MHGWLEKRADWKMLWNRRLFTLKGDALSYKETESDVNDKNCIYVASLQRVVDDPCCLRVQNEAGTWWLLRANTAEVASQWIDALETVLRSCTRNTTVVSGPVEKRSEWLHQWRPRYVWMRGSELTYAEEQGGAVKKRYIVVAVDSHPTKLNEIRVSTSAGESFLLRLASQEEAELWVARMRNAIRPSMTWRWQLIDPRFVPPDDPAAVDGLRASNHAAVVSDSGNILMFGGTTTNEDGSITLHNDVVCFEPSSEHEVSVVPVDAFQEGIGAKVRPAPREAHAIALLNGRLYLHGGCDQSTVLQDMWMINLRGPTVAWVRLTLSRSSEQTLLPGLCGHTMTALPATGQLVVIGGLDADGQPSVNTYLYTPTAHSCEMMAPLKQPRCRHGAAVLPDGHMIVVGGVKHRSHSDPLTTVEIYSPRKQRWRDAHLSAPVPPLISPAVAQHDMGAFVFGGDGQTSTNAGPSRLLFLHWQQDISTIVVREIQSLGSMPRLHYGLSAHIVGRGPFLYVLGDGSTPATKGRYAYRVMLPAAEVTSVSEEEVAEGAGGPTASAAASSSHRPVTAVEAM